MKKKEWENLKTKPQIELEKNLKSFRERLGKLKSDLVSGKVKNIREIKESKKVIARILTLMREKIS
jgi:ribosomal protein L29